MKAAALLTITSRFGTKCFSIPFQCDDKKYFMLYIIGVETVVVVVTVFKETKQLIEKKIHKLIKWKEM